MELLNLFHSPKISSSEPIIYIRPISLTLELVLPNRQNCEFLNLIDIRSFTWHSQTKFSRRVLNWLLAAEECLPLISKLPFFLHLKTGKIAHLNAVVGLKSQEKSRQAEEKRWNPKRTILLLWKTNITSFVPIKRLNSDSDGNEV